MQWELIWGGGGLIRASWRYTTFNPRDHIERSSPSPHKDFREHKRRNFDVTLFKCSENISN